MARQHRKTSRNIVEADRARVYGNPYPLPLVYGLPTASGADYNDPARYQAEQFDDNSFPFFPTSWLGRMQTPISRISANVGVGVTLSAWDPRTGNRRASGC